MGGSNGALFKEVAAFQRCPLINTDFTVYHQHRSPSKTKWSLKSTATQHAHVHSLAYAICERDLHSRPEVNSNLGLLATAGLLSTYVALHNLQC